MKQLLTFVLLMVVMSVCSAQEETKQRDCFHKHPDFEKSIGYCSAVRVGDTLYVSGVTSPGPMDEAIAHVYTGIGDVLQQYDLTLRDVVKETVYAVDLQGFIDNTEVRKPYYKGEYPAATWVGVERLFTPELILEVEVVAVFPQN